MSSNGDEVRAAAVRELARRELARRLQAQQPPPPTAMQKLMGYLTTAPEAPPRMPIKDLAIGAADMGISMLRGMVNYPAEKVLAGGLGAIKGALDPNQTAAEGYREGAANYRKAVQSGDTIVRDERLRTRQGEQMAAALGQGLQAFGVPQALGAAKRGIASVTSPEVADFAGGVASLAVPAASKMPLGRLVGGAAKAAAPTIQELKAASQAAYKAAESGSGIVAQSSLGGLAGRIEKMLANEGADQTLHPATMAGFNRVMDEATRPGIAGHSLKGLEVQRRILSAAESAAKAGSDDARLAGKMVDEFDDFIDKLSPKDLVGGKGDAAAAAKNYATARAYWSRMRKAETIESLVERAKNSSPSLTQSGYENALRLEFKSLANNERRMRYFTPEERAAITEVVRGSTAQRMARQVGKFAVRGPVSGGTSLLVGSTATPAAGMALAGLGEAGALAARLLRLRSVERVRNLVRGGGGLQNQAAAARTRPALPGRYSPAAFAGLVATRNSLPPLETETQ